MSKKIYFVDDNLIKVGTLVKKMARAIAAEDQKADFQLIGIVHEKIDLDRKEKRKEKLNSLKNDIKNRYDMNLNIKEIEVMDLDLGEDDMKQQLIEDIFNSENGGIDLQQVQQQRAIVMLDLILFVGDDKKIQNNKEILSQRIYRMLEGNCYPYTAFEDSHQANKWREAFQTDLNQYPKVWWRDQIGELAILDSEFKDKLLDFVIPANAE